jgi:hypothetical protein
MIGTTFDSLTTALCSKLITHSENEINKYLSNRYNISAFNTSGSVPPLVTSLCETLVEGYMYQRMSRGGKEMLANGSALIKQAKENLMMINEYKMNLLNTAGSLISDASNTGYVVLSNTTDYSNTFNEDSELLWAIDEDKLDDIESERD